MNYKNDGFFIHVDKKVDINPFLKQCKGLNNVHFVSEEKRVKNYWGGFNSIIATFNTIELALKTGKYDRFVLLQGQDYPLFSNEFIHDFFIDHINTEFCKAKNISASKNKSDYMKVGGYWHFDGRNFFWRIIHKLNSVIGVKYRPLKYKNKGTCWNVYHSRAYFSLTLPCIEYCFDVFKYNKGYNRFMKHRFPPDEIYIPTIIHNSKYKLNIWDKIIYNRYGETARLDLTYFEYPKVATVFRDKSDYYWLKDIGCLFVRKVNSSSKDLIEEIDKNILKG